MVRHSDIAPCAALTLLALACDAFNRERPRCEASPGPNWTVVAPMAVPRSGHTVTLLDSGQVLVAGGLRNHDYPDGIEASAEVYDPATDRWHPVGSMHLPRRSHRTVRLRGSGKVLVVGGQDGPSPAEVFDPAAETWTQTGPLSIGHNVGALVALSDGSALVFGGFAQEGVPTTRIERYDPMSNTWSVVGDTLAASTYDVAARIEDGSVLLSGRELTPTGNTTASERFDPSTGVSRNTGPQARPHAYCGALAQLADGRLLLTGGESEDPPSGPSREAFVPWLDVAEVFDPVSDTWRTTQPMSSDRCAHTLTTLLDGRVLAAGGWHDVREFRVHSHTEIYDPASGTWSPSGSMHACRAQHGAVRLQDGRVLVVGGEDERGILASAEVYDPGTR